MTEEEKRAIELLENIERNKQECLMLECPVVKNNVKRQLKIIELKKELDKKDKVIKELKENDLSEEYDKAIKNYYDEYNERIKAEKVIDLMAEWLYKDDTSFGLFELREINTKEKIKQYFYKEVEEENE